MRSSSLDANGQKCRTVVALLERCRLDVEPIDGELGANQGSRKFVTHLAFPCGYRLARSSLQIGATRRQVVESANCRCELVVLVECSERVVLVGPEPGFVPRGPHHLEATARVVELECLRKQPYSLRERRRPGLDFSQREATSVDDDFLVDLAGAPAFFGVDDADRNIARAPRLEPDDLSGLDRLLHQCNCQRDDDRARDLAL